MGYEASLSARRRSMTANCTETSGYKAGRFSFSGPARATAAPASVPTVSSVLGVSSVSGRTDRTERRDMPRIGPFVLARSIDGSSFFL